MVLLCADAGIPAFGVLLEAELASESYACAVQFGGSGAGASTGV